VVFSNRINADELIRQLADAVGEQCAISNVINRWQTRKKKKENNSNNKL